MQPTVLMLNSGDAALDRALSALALRRYEEHRAAQRAARGAISAQDLHLKREATARAVALVEQLRAQRNLAGRKNLVGRKIPVAPLNPATGIVIAVTPPPQVVVQPTALTASSSQPPTAVVPPVVPQPPTTVTPPVQVATAATPEGHNEAHNALSDGAPPTVVAQVSPANNGSTPGVSTPPVQRPQPGASLPLKVVSLPPTMQTALTPSASNPAPVGTTGSAATAVSAQPRVLPQAVPQTKLQSAPALSVAKPAPARSRTKELELLARLDAELENKQQGLNQANTNLDKGERQLEGFGDRLRQAMLEGENTRGTNSFVLTAKDYAGTPYVWGGESARGFDCSGFIIRVMRDLGYPAPPHSAAEQYKYGKPIAEALLKPGDLVFFANTYKLGISHVGIYLGKRRFIHAAGTGKGTIVSSLDESKFRRKFAGARRLVRVH